MDIDNQEMNLYHLGQKDILFGIVMEIIVQVIVDPIKMI